MKKLVNYEQLWKDFLTFWTPERVKNMTLEEYTNLEQNNSFCYWLESRTTDLGSIWGGSAYKFGIYKRKDTEKEVNRKGYKTDGEYAWVLKYGHDRDDAFQTVKKRIIQVMEAAIADDLAVVDEVDLGETYKWKIAALYNKKIPLFYKPSALNFIADKMDIDTKLPSSVKYKELGKLSDGKSIIDHSWDLWRLYEKPEEKTEKIKETLDSWHTPLNQILFGPPGTGKTYITVDESVKIVERLSDNAFENKYNNDRQAIKDAYKKYLDDGQIVFCTFHQSFCYEDFIEGIKPVKPGDEDEFLKYEVRPGIFKDIANNAVSRIISEANKSKSFLTLSDEDYNRTAFYKLSLGDINVPEDQEIYDYCLSNGYISIGFVEGIDFSGKNESEINEIIEKNKYSSFAAQALNYFKNYLKTGNYVIVSKGNNFARAISRVTGEYEYLKESPIRHNHFRKVEWIIKDEEIPVSDIYEKSFSQQTIYKLNQEWINRDFFRSDLAIDKRNPVAQKPKNYVLIIDEINRGNVSQIFGELITLIEEDKRASGKEALKVVLPYSKEEFSVPSNLYLLGTMNTADRSIEALDTALRRRFSFTEMPSDAELIQLLHADILGASLQNLSKDIGDTQRKNITDEITNFFSNRDYFNNIRDEITDKYIKGEIDSQIDIEGLAEDLATNNIEMLDFKRMLEAMNDRLEKLIDKDHTIGHGFFMPIPESILPYTALYDIFENKIIPLLQEFFFGDFGKIGLVLGDSFVEVHNHKEFRFANFSAYDASVKNDLKERSIYRIREKHHWDFFSIYK